MSRRKKGGVRVPYDGREWWDKDEPEPWSKKAGPVIMGPAAVKPVQPSGAYTPQGWQGSGSGSSYVHTKKCPGHDGLTVVHCYPDGTTLSGASRYDLLKHGVDLLIDCGVEVGNTPFVKTFPAGFGGLSAFGVIPNVLRLDWPDRSAPPVGWEFWRVLRGLFKPNWNVVACCIGGHGRTGTCLASLLIEDGMSTEDAIEHVRTVHCTDAVESVAQELYLSWLGSVMPPREEEKA